MIPKKTLRSMRDAHLCHFPGCKLPVPPLKLRIARAVQASNPISYYELMRVVFPRDQYPNATRYKTDGGPPGCAMAFGKALRELKAHWSRERIFLTDEMHAVLRANGE